MKKRVTILLILFASIATISLSHSGRTDSSGGHYNRSTGEYHYHHGYSAHQHSNGVCPYEITTTSNEETYIVSKDDDESSEINELNKKIEKLQLQIDTQEEKIEGLNNEIEEKDDKINRLNDDKTALHYIYWFVIICIIFYIIALKQDNKPKEK